MRKLAVDTVSQLAYAPSKVSKFYKLQIKKGELIEKKFHLFPYPHVEKIFAEENLFGYGYDNLMTKNELEDYEHVKVVNNVVYILASVKIVFLDGSEKIDWYINDSNAFDRYNELKIMLNLKEIEE